MSKNSEIKFIGEPEDSVSSWQQATSLKRSDIVCLGLAFGMLRGLGVREACIMSVITGFPNSFNIFLDVKILHPLAIRM